MLRIVKLGVFLVIVLSTKAFSQNYINSPYTQFIPGDLIDDGFALNRSMGGSSIGLRPHNCVNYLNPASYTTQDTNSFLFMLGFTGRDAEISSETESLQSINFNVDYIAIGFPITKWWNMSIGAVPFSRIHYNIREERDSVVLGEDYTHDFSGFGGFNEFYIGNAVKIGNILSLGVNASYLFGSLDLTDISYLTNLQYYSARIEQKSSYISGDFYFKLGAQFHPVIKEKHKIIIGATYDLQTDIDLKLKVKTTRMNEFGSSDSRYWLIDTVNFSTSEAEPLRLPGRLAFGLSYNYNDVLTISGEYIRQDWSGINNDNPNVTYGLSESYRFGVEFIPVPIDKRINSSYFEHINYRAGVYQNKTYLNINNKNISNYGFSIGLGLPIKYERKAYTGTMFNIGYQYGIRGTTENGLVKENTHTLTMGLTLHDFWFMKRKYD